MFKDVNNEAHGAEKYIFNHKFIDFFLVLHDYFLGIKHCKLPYAI